MNNEIPNGFKQVQVRSRLAKRLKTLSFNHDVEIRVLASEIMEQCLNDEKMLREILAKLKAKR